MTEIVIVMWRLSCPRRETEKLRKQTGRMQLPPNNCKFKTKTSHQTSEYHMKRMENVPHHPYDPYVGL